MDLFGKDFIVSQVRSLADIIQRISGICKSQALLQTYSL